MTEMKAKFVLMTIMVIALQFFWAAGDAQSINPNIILTNYTLSESPASAGHEITLMLHFDDVGSHSCAYITQVQLTTSYPLSVIGNDARYIGSICPNVTNSTVYFKLLVDQLAQKGTYPVSVLTTYQKDYDKFSTSNTINIRVGGEPSFSASIMSSNPVDIYPGDKADLTVKFQNNGAGQADSVRVLFSAQPGIEVKWAGATQEIGSIASHGSAMATFSLEADKNLVPGTYTINATLEYYNGDSSQQHTFLLDMTVSSKAEFSAVDGIPFYAGQNRLNTITLKNSGSEEARNLKVRIMPLFPFSTDGTVRYIDSLKPGEEKRINFMLHVDEDATPGRQVAGLVIDFEDAQGKKFTDTIDVMFNVTEKDLSYYLAIYWPLIILILVAILAYITRKKFSSIIKTKRKK